MRRGARVAVDVGSVRIGVARSDPDGLLATPVETVARTRSDDGVARVAAIVAELDALEVIVGLPRSLDGKEREAAGLVRTWSQRLARQVAPVGVRLYDERLTTATASRAMREAGRSARRQRSVIDQAAATAILQSALDLERATGRAPGTGMSSGAAR